MNPGRRRFMRELAEAQAEDMAAVGRPGGGGGGHAAAPPPSLAGGIGGASRRVVAVAQAAAKQAPGDPAVPALGVGAVTWLLLTGRWTSRRVRAASCSRARC
jgi:hypothetical protein